MTSIIAFLKKNWKLVSVFVAFIAVVSFFGIMLAVESGKLKDMTDQRDKFQKESSEWQASHAKLDLARLQLEADKEALNLKLEQTKQAESLARGAAARNASEAARITSLLRELQDDPESDVRVPSRAIDFLRQRQAEQTP